MQSSHADRSCASGDLTSEDVRDHQNTQKGTCIITSHMGGHNSVPELIEEDSLKQNVELTRNCQGSEGINDAKDIRLGESCQEVNAREKERTVSNDNPVDCRTVDDVSVGSMQFETRNKEKTLDEKENNFAKENPVSEDINKHKVLGILEKAQKDAISSHDSCGSLGNITTVDFQDKSEVKNKSDDGSREGNKESIEQKNEEHNASSVHETVDIVLDNCSRDNGNISNDNINEKIDINDVECNKKTTKEIVPSLCQNLNSCEGENNMNNEEGLERTHTNIEIPPEMVEKQMNMSLLDKRNEKEGESSVAECAEESCNIIDQSANGQKHQIYNEPIKNKVLLGNKDQETNEIKMISISAKEFQGNQEQLKMDEEHQITNTCDMENNEIQRECELSMQNVTSKTSVSECDIKINTCEDNLNEENSEKLLLQAQELSTNIEKLLTKQCAGSSCENSPRKKSPIFQRGLFPRIAIRDYGMHPINKKKQLFVGKETRGKREQQEGDKTSRIKKQRQERVNDSNNLSEITKTCGSSNDIKLKCAQVYLVKMSASLLSKYNVHCPSLNSGGSGDKLNAVSLCGDKKSSVSEKNNLNPEVGFQVESSVSFENDIELKKKKLSISASNNLNPEVEFQVESAVPFDGGIDHEKNNKLLSMEDSNQLQKMSISISDAPPSSELASLNIVSNSRTNCDTSTPENILNNSKETDNSLLGVDIRRGSKRRESAQVLAPTKKQKQSKIKIARVHIWKIDNSVLLQYGYDSQGLRIDKADVVQSPAHSSSVSTLVDNSQKAVENDALKGQILLNRTCVQSKIPYSFSDTMEVGTQLATMKNSGKDKINDDIEKSANSHKNCNSETAPKKINDDVTLSSFVLQKTTLSTAKLMGKTRSSVVNNNWNLKTPQIIVKKIDKIALSRNMLSKKEPNRSYTKTNHKTKSSLKTTDLNGKTSQMVARKIKNVPLSRRILLNRSRSMKKSKSKKKISIKSDYNLKTAHVILKNINNSPLIRQILPEYLPTKTKRSAKVSKPKQDVQATEILQERSSPKKQIISQSKYCNGTQDQNEVVNKGRSRKDDVQDRSKENVCLNSDLKCLKGVRVSLYKLESMIGTKLLPSKPVFSS